MIVRRCSGGVVFYANKVLLVENDRGEWTLPKGKIVGDGLPHESAIQRVKLETGVDARILYIAGDTIYEFFSRSRNQRVCNAIMWYVRRGGFYTGSEALEMLTHSTEKSLVDVSYKKYKNYKKNDTN